MERPAGPSCSDNPRVFAPRVYLVIGVLGFEGRGEKPMKHPSKLFIASFFSAGGGRSFY